MLSYINKEWSDSMLILYFMIYVIFIGIFDIILYVKKFKNNYSLYSFIDYTFHTVLNLTVILLCIYFFFPKSYRWNDIVPYVRETICLIIAIIYSISYLSLDINKAYYPLINQIVKIFLIITYAITTFVLIIIRYEFDVFISTYYYLIVSIFTLLAHAFIYYSHAFLKEIDTKKANIVKNKKAIVEKKIELEEIRESVLTIQDELITKSRVVNSDQLLFHKLRNNSFKALDIYNLEEKQEIYNDLIDTMFYLVSTKGYYHCGYELMNKVLALYSEALYKRKIKLLVDFRRVELNMKEIEQVALFRLFLDYIMQECYDEFVKIKSLYDGKLTYFLITFHSKCDDILDPDFEELCLKHGFYTSSTIHNNNRQVLIYQ